MSIKWISSAWKEDLKTTWPQDHRVYIDFRQKQYPLFAGTPSYTLITSADNQPGSHNLTGGHIATLLDMTSTMIITAKVKPTFAYDIASHQTVWSWYNDATHYLTCLYDATNDCYSVAWRDGGIERTLVSTAYTDTTSLQVWTEITASLGLTASATTGSELYIDRATADTAWSGAKDVKASNFPKFEIRSQNTTSGLFTINHVRLIQSAAATAGDVTGNLKNRKDEEIVWHFNGHPLGKSRCNVSGRVQTFSIERTIESAAGNCNANTCDVNLMSPDGQFADDQYAAFAPTSEVYNGSSAQKYMQTRCPIEIETWYENTYECEFYGRIDDSLFKRRSTYNDISRVTVTGLDGADEMKRRVRQKAYSWENYELCNPTTSTTSLLHVIAKMETQKEWYNFLANASFENTTAANSWVVSGTSSTITRAAGGLHGSYQGDLLCGGTSASLKQTVTYSDSKKINLGQDWTFSIYGKTATGVTATLGIEEMTAASAITVTTSTTMLFAAGDFWKKMEKTVTVSTSSTAWLRCGVTIASASTLSLDCAMLIQNKESLNWFVPNDNNGAAGVENADDADSAVYDSVGFDVDDAMVIHPWAILYQGEPIWNTLQQIGDATGASYLGMDSAGTFKYRSPLKASYADPSSLITITSLQSVDTVIDVAQANKIKIHGVRIIKDQVMRTCWTAKDSGSFDVTSAGTIAEVVANGKTWPSSATYGEYWAQYMDTTLAAAYRTPPYIVRPR